MLVWGCVCLVAVRLLLTCNALANAQGSLGVLNSVVK